MAVRASKRTETIQKSNPEDPEMYLPDVQNAEGDPYGETIRQCRAAGMPVPELANLLAFKPERNQFLSRFTHEVLRGPSPLSTGLRELIAAFVSRRNECLF